MDSKNSIRSIKFTPYETIWLFTIVVLAGIVSIISPEENLPLTILGFLIVTIGCFCELLFSKQLRWAFLIYNAVELLSVPYYYMLGWYPSMVSALVYWIPAHTIGFFFWNRHKDRKDSQKTVVRRLKWWQTLLIFVIMILGSFGIGYFTREIAPMPSSYTSELGWEVVFYLEAALFIMNIIDGVLMFFRSKDSWWTWFFYIFVDVVRIIIASIISTDKSWVMLVYSFGYATNTTYGLFKWSKYIKENESKE